MYTMLFRYILFKEKAAEKEKTKFCGMKTVLESILNEGVKKKSIISVSNSRDPERKTFIFITSIR